jgi:hypothetical protein
VAGSVHGQNRAALKQRQTTTDMAILGSWLHLSSGRISTVVVLVMGGLAPGSFWPVETATNTGSGAVPRPCQHPGVQNCSDGLLAGEGDEGQ